ncbi:MAG: hypothetical protein HC836_28795 [Richelia sp. RM2_1_2]|nr:hypothetical protein [Richelia sp. SM1_7_0]NJN11034.1 hypothetical protein [Richelia sp. RM1_1_1]NJO31539.1 hypothetical protein [Richelia sp. SL_2_1]NJO62087.1 hypothetical protein [Richelia sp. RM2_1_2]
MSSFKNIRFNITSVSPDGNNKVNVNPGDTTIKLTTLNKTLILRGHTSSVNSFNFSKDSKILASASVDGTIKLWSLEGSELTTLNSYNGSVTSISFSPDGKTLASAHTDGTIIFWNFDIDDLLKKGCEHLHDYLQNNPNVSPEDKRLCGNIKL